jgi:hypothetical protein
MRPKALTHYYEAKEHPLDLTDFSLNESVKSWVIQLFFIFTYYLFCISWQ